MSGVIEARAVISATDKTAGVFEKIAAKFKSIAGDAKALEGVKPLSGFGGGFQKELDRLKLTAKEIDIVRRSWESYNAALKSGGPMKAATYFGAVSNWKDKTIADLRAVRLSMEQTERAKSKMFGGAGGRFALTALGVGSSAYAANRGIRGTISAGAENMRESARDYLAGMSDAESARIKSGAMDLSSRYNSISAATLHERLRDTSMSMRSVDKAMELGDTIAQGHVVLQSLKGKERAGEESRKFFRGLDTLGKNLDGGEVKTLYDGYVKALGVEGNDMNLGDIFTLAKRSKSAGAALSNRFLMSIAPGLMQDMSPDRVGTALGSSLSQVIGGRATKESKAAQSDYGLRDANGNFLNDREVMSDPFQYTIDRLIPALRKKGVDVDDNLSVTSATSKLFSNQMVADLFTKMVTQRGQYAAKGEQYDRAPGISAGLELGKRDPFVAAGGFVEQLKNMASTLSEPVFPSAISILNSMSGAIGNMAKEFSEGDTSGKLKSGAILGGSSLVAGGAGIVGARMAYQWFTGAGALSGSAAALNASAAALTAAAAELAGGGAAKSATDAAGKVSPGWLAALGAGATVGGTILGGVGASFLAKNVFKAHPELSEAYENPMLGAMDSDGALASSILNAKPRQTGASGDFGGDWSGSSGKEVTAKVEGNATITGQITVQPTPMFWSTIDTKIDNKINAFKSTNITGQGTQGSTGRSSPDTAPTP